MHFDGEICGHQEVLGLAVTLMPLECPMDSYLKDEKQVKKQENDRAHYHSQRETISFIRKSGN